MPNVFAWKPSSPTARPRLPPPHTHIPENTHTTLEHKGGVRAQPKTRRGTANNRNHRRNCTASPASSLRSSVIPRPPLPAPC